MSRIWTFGRTRIRVDLTQQIHICRSSTFRQTSTKKVSPVSTLYSNPTGDWHLRVVYLLAFMHLWSDVGYREGGQITFIKSFTLSDFSQKPLLKFAVNGSRPFLPRPLEQYCAFWSILFFGCQENTPYDIFLYQLPSEPNYEVVSDLYVRGAKRPRRGEGRLQKYCRAKTGDANPSVRLFGGPWTAFHPDEARDLQASSPFMVARQHD
ncbi:hypothetical protein BDP27DRAFT_1361012 [Rhodocollybia butyracea]|uniref:Uncharacterized protein n=1 Tax=Rhodocollybia butyracea TaxID=206335 RepID=A0A9P5UAV9_9AGAR|nr:hypothetical protein BDP27DRAFT_1361012 [Rhodocollybia butyracea]